MIADFFNYLFSNIKLQEFTLATTSQMFDPRKNMWSKELMEKLNLPYYVMPKIIKPGTIIGKVVPHLEKEIGLKNVKVIATGSHDTASAVAAVPMFNENCVYLSSGTWSLLGVELRKPLINKDVLKENFTNEGGVAGTYRFLKNINGLWLLQQCRKKWGVDYETINKLVKKARKFSASIDVDAPVFINPKDMEHEIIQYCKKTKQNLDVSKGGIARCILESLVLKYRFVIERIERLTHRKIETLHIVGGGSKNKLLCQMIADALKIPVIAGPVEATAIGNIMMQAIANGYITSVKEGRKIIRNSFGLITYKPQDTPIWDSVYNKYLIRGNSGDGSLN